MLPTGAGKRIAEDIRTANLPIRFEYDAASGVNRAYYVTDSPSLSQDQADVIRRSRLVGAIGQYPGLGPTAPLEF